MSTGRVWTGGRERARLANTEGELPPCGREVVVVKGWRWGWQTARRPDGWSGCWRAKMPLAGLGTPRSGEAVIPFGRVSSQGLLGLLVGRSRKLGLGGSGAQERGLGWREVWGLEHKEDDLTGIAAITAARSLQSDF